MKVLIIGGGGREHALAWKSAQSPLVDEVLVAPGNAGTANEPRVRNVAVSAGDIDALLALAREEHVDLTIVGPEQPLVDGIVDRFDAAGMKCFGPIAAAARLEGSKVFTKEFLDRHGIPTAAYRSFTDFDAASAYLDECSVPIVIKADGLAAGKGVVVAQTKQEAELSLRRILRDRVHGSAGSTIVIEECLTGEEASFIAMVDGRKILPMASSQDHKARDDGDRGPNTGGMGAYSPAPVVDAGMHAKIMRDVMQPTVDALADDGIYYRGFLYAGLMIDANGQAKVLEFNCRFGDPETQPILFRLESDLVELCLRCFDHSLDQANAVWTPEATVGVVMASGGYPDSYETGKPITGIEDAASPAVKVFHAGTRIEDGTTVTAGGRVLCVVARGDTVGIARQIAYAAVEKIKWDGAFWRTDIGYRAVQRERET